MQTIKLWVYFFKLVWKHGFWKAKRILESEAAKARMDIINLKITISPDNDIPAFAGYVNHSVDDNKPEIVVNFRASLIACAEENINYKQLFAENVVHEMLHMIQDIFDQAFSEEEVEDAIFHARKFLKERQ